MNKSGKALETLVAYIERLLLPPGFEAKTNTRVFNEEGVQIAEFDVEIRGKLGSTEIAWLIECRDRPSFGPSPASWIEQLVGRKERFKFNKVTAVSTTGFAEPALEWAQRAGIELREVRSLAPEEFSGWLNVEGYNITTMNQHLEDVEILASDNLSAVTLDALREAIQGLNSEKPILRKSTTSELVSLNEVFNVVMEQNPNLFEDVVPNGESKPIYLRTVYTNDLDHFLVDTKAGPVRILEVKFTALLSVVQSKAFPTDTKQYTHTSSGTSIAQSATLKFETSGKQMTLDMHKLSEADQTHLMLHVGSGEDV